MDQHVTKSDDLGQIGHHRGDFRSDPAQTDERLAMISN